MLAGQHSEPERLLIVGSVPRPIGGVSQHCWRLASRAGLRLANRCRVLDLQPARMKYPSVGFQLDVGPRGRLRLPLWLLSQIASSSAEVVHFHLSVTDHLAYTGHLLQRAARGKRTVLTLHHGDQRTFFERHRSAVQRRIMQVLQRFDQVVASTDEQFVYYQDAFGIARDQLLRANNYIALTEPIMNALGETSRSSAVRREGEMFCLSSGSFLPLYRHDWAIRVIDRLRQDWDAHLGICLYGKTVPECEQEILALAASRPYVHLYRNVDLADFLRLQQSADLYLRPTTIDSCGIAVADSVALGTPAVASDVCARPAATTLFPAHSYEAFETAVLRHARQPANPEQLRRCADYDAFDEILRAYGDSFASARSDQRLKAA